MRGKQIEMRVVYADRRVYGLVQSKHIQTMARVSLFGICNIAERLTLSAIYQPQVV